MRAKWEPSWSRQRLGVDVGFFVSNFHGYGHLWVGEVHFWFFLAERIEDLFSKVSANLLARVRVDSDAVASYGEGRIFFDSFIGDFKRGCGDIVEFGCGLFCGGDAANAEDSC